MYCNQCGGKVDPQRQRFCSGCGKQLPFQTAAVPPPNPVAQPVSKGQLLGEVTPGVTLARRFSIVLMIVFGGINLAVLASGQPEFLFFTGWGLLFGVLSWSVPRLLVGTVRVYENGLERNVAKTWSQQMFLPWSEITNYEWKGDILHIRWREKAFLHFKGSETRTARKLDGVRPGIRYDYFKPSFYYGFPADLHVPPDKAELLRGLLARSEGA